MDEYTVFCWRQMEHLCEEEVREVEAWIEDSHSEKRRMSMSWFPAQCRQS